MARDEHGLVGTLVIGGGQAGLAVGYHLARRGQDFLILDAADEVGESWRARWDSLQLFTPAGFTKLPGLSFPTDPRTHPGKDAVADYLADYAQRFRLPVNLRTRVDGVSRDGSEFVVTAGRRRWRTRNVVIASGAYTRPVVPALTDDVDPSILQLHAYDYRRPDQLPTGRVLVVGAGNSGAEIALDIATEPGADREVLLAGRNVGHIPNLGSWTFQIMQRLGHVGAALARRGLNGRGDPLGRLKPGQLEAAGVQRLPPVVGIRHGQPVLADDRIAAAAAVVWCTGLRSDYAWLHLDVLDAAGRLRHRSGVVSGEPGLYAVGLPYQRSITSHLLGGVSADAEYVVDRITNRW